jgi:protein-S-isoprenylcysteine O-methyltransferase Ste14
MVVVGAERMWETFLTKRSFEKGIVFKRWTLWALTFVYVLIMLLTLLEFLFIHEAVHYSISFLGLLLFVSALLGRNWSIKTLGKFHSNNIEIKNDHKLVKKGPYRFLRHPYYLSMMLEVTGITLIANSVYAFYLAIFGYVPLALLRAYYEERSMIKQFGAIYLNYKSEVNAFLPLKGIKEKS